MYLNVILTIFVIVQVVTMILVYKWWKKYGKNLFSSIKKGFPSQMMNSMSKGPNPFGNIPDMSQMMKQFESMTKNMGKK
jgi:hypothetical protein